MPPPASGLPLVQFADNLPLHRLPADELDALGRRARAPLA